MRTLNGKRTDSKTLACNKSWHRPNDTRSNSGMFQILISNVKKSEPNWKRILPNNERNNHMERIVATRALLEDWRKIPFNARETSWNMCGKHEKGTRRCVTARLILTDNRILKLLYEQQIGRIWPLSGLQYRLSFEVSCRTGAVSSVRLWLNLEEDGCTFSIDPIVCRSLSLGYVARKSSRILDGMSEPTTWFRKTERNCVGISDGKTSMLSYHYHPHYIDHISATSLQSWQ